MKKVVFLIFLVLAMPICFAKNVEIPGVSEGDVDVGGPEIMPEEGENYYAVLNENVVASSGSGVEYYHKDRLGSNVVVSDEGVKRSKTLPYGESLENEGIKYTFTEKELDASGLYYFGARYYDCDSGRFLETDPIMDNHAYAYSNNPLRFVDPTGMQEEPSKEQHMNWLSLDRQEVVDHIHYYLREESQYAYVRPATLAAKVAKEFDLPEGGGAWVEGIIGEMWSDGYVPMDAEGEPMQGLWALQKWKHTETGEFYYRYPGRHTQRETSLVEEFKSIFRAFQGPRLERVLSPREIAKDLRDAVDAIEYATEWGAIITSYRPNGVFSEGGQELGMWDRWRRAGEARTKGLYRIDVHVDPDGVGGTIEIYKGKGSRLRYEVGDFWEAGFPRYKPEALLKPQTESIGTGLGSGNIVSISRYGQYE